jgi:tetratricopeptide (TPR) repeat protein
MAKRRGRATIHGKSFGAVITDAQAKQRQGRHREAVALYEQAIRIDGSVPEAHNNLGCALLALGRLDEAVVALSHAVALRPSYAEAHDTLGVALAGTGRHREAAEAFERALAANPAAAEAAFHLGNSLLVLERLPEARAAFERALELRPAYAGARNGLGAVFDRLGDASAAVAAFRATLAIDPAFADAAYNLGRVLLETGEVGEAAGWFERALELEPRNGRFHLQFVRSRSQPVGAARLATMEGLNKPGSIELHFALAKAYEDAERYDDAFGALVAGNALKRAELAYDPAADLNLLASLERTIDAPFVEGLRGYGNRSARPIFVFGMARSGSTLVEQILAAHPAVAAAGEIAEFGRLTAEVRPPIGTGAPAAETGAALRTIGNRYLAATAQFAGTATHVTDKTLANFSLAPLIHVALPNARMIHVRRDRLDTCFSCFATLFLGTYVPFSYDLGELARYYQAYDRLVTHWRAILPADRFLEVSYEAVVADLETEARRIVAFCGLPWDDACLAFQGARRAVRTASAFQVRQPLYDSSIGRAMRFATHLAPLITATPAYSRP